MTLTALRDDSSICGAMENEYDIITLDRVDSTNTFLISRRDLWDRQFLMVRADTQTGGRGRLGRGWHQDPGKDLAFSMLYRPPGKRTGGPVTLRAGLAAWNALFGHTGIGLRLKWPNDLYFDGKKLGGILCEAVPDGDGRVIVIGIGINVNAVDFPRDIRDSSVSLKLVSGGDFAVETIMKEIATFLVPSLDGPDFLTETELKALAEIMDAVGHRVFFAHGGEKRIGVVTGISESGRLDVMTESGRTVSVDDAVFC